MALTVPYLLFTVFTKSSDLLRSTLPAAFAILAFVSARSTRILSKFSNILWSKFKYVMLILSRPTNSIVIILGRKFIGYVTKQGGWKNISDKDCDMLWWVTVNWNGDYELPTESTQMDFSIRVPDPDPPDPHVFRPPGSGSFYHQAKIARKTLIPTVLWLLLDFLSLKNDINVPSKSNKQNFFFISFLLASWRSMTKIGRSGSISQRHGSANPDTDPHQNVMDPEHCLTLSKWYARTRTSASRASKRGATPALHGCTRCILGNKCTKKHDLKTVQIRETVWK